MCIFLPAEATSSGALFTMSYAYSCLQRREAVNRFRSDSSIRVALLSITAAAVGLDFSSASAVVFVELPHEVCFRPGCFNHHL